MTEAYLKSRLIEAAYDMIRSGESSALSLRAVARKAGVSEAAPYTWFKGKAELMAHVAALGFKALNRAMAACPPDADPIETLCAMGRAYLDFAEAEPALYALMFSDDAGLDRTLPAYVAESAACFERLSLTASRCARVEPDSETVDEMWALFSELEAAGADVERRWALTLTALFQDFRMAHY